MYTTKRFFGNSIGENLKSQIRLLYIWREKLWAKPQLTDI